MKNSHCPSQHRSTCYGSLRSIYIAAGSILAAISALASTPLNPGDLVIVKATDTELYRYQPGTGTVSLIATVGTFANDVALGDGPFAGKAWVASHDPQIIQFVDLATGTVTPFASGERYLALAYHDGRLYATAVDNRVLVYDGGTGALLNSYIYSGETVQFLGIRYDALNDRMVLSEGAAGAIYAMTLSGTFSALASGWGPDGAYHIAIESNGNILVSGYIGETIKRVEVHAGNAVSTVASGPPLSDPVGVAVDATGQIYAANFGDGNLVRMNADGSAVVSLGSIGAPGGRLYSLVVVPTTASTGTEGDPWAWGRGSDGQLGNGTFYTTSPPYYASSTPGEVNALPGGRKTVAIAGGQYHSLALADDGSAWAWGYGYYGELGNGTFYTSGNQGSSTPVEVNAMPGGRKAVAIAGGSAHSLALADDGSVWAWGVGGAGQLGNGTVINSSTPVQVNALPGGRKAVAIAGGYNHSLALADDGSVWAWGYGFYGQLGNGTFSNNSTPVLVNALPAGRMAVAIAGGENHSLALADDGNVWAWGGGYYGQLGNGTFSNSSTPVQVKALSAGRKAVAITGGQFHSLALAADGSVWAWGDGLYGQLGNGIFYTSGNQGSSTPVQATGFPVGRSVLAVAAGGQHSLAILSSANQAPVANGQTVTTTEDARASITLAGSDPENYPLTFSIVSGPTQGALGGTPPNVIYTPAANYNGADSFSFKVNDGTQDSAPATVSITVTPVNDPPVANPDFFTIPEDTPLRADDVLSNDTDADGDPLAVVEVRVPSHGNFGDLGGVFAYFPAPDYFGQDSFRYIISDGHGATSTNFAYITVTPVNDPPVLQPIPDIEVTYGQFFQIPLSGVDIDALENEITLGVSGIPLGVGYRLDRPTGTVFTGEIFGPALQTGTFRVDVTIIDCCVDTHALFNLTVNPARPTLTSLNPNTIATGSPSFTLTLNGSDFADGAAVLWNGTVRPTTVVSASQLTAVIPSSDIVGGSEISTVLVRVQNQNGSLSNPQSFTITPANVSAVQSTAAEAGQTMTVSTAPTSVGSAGVSATVNNTGGDPVSVTVANYSSNPSGTAFSAGGGFTDVQIIGADSADTATVNFYYPSTVDPATEVALTLVYYNGSGWIPVQSDGNTDPTKNTNNNLDGTISGGRFTGIFSSTSTPKITELSGTVFAAADLTPVIILISTPASPTQVQTAVPISISYSAAGNASSHRVTLNWDDGSSSVITPATSGIVNAAHVYSAPGVYSIMVTLNDGVHPPVQAVSQYVVIYDPNGGFVTGGGWINSPAGAYVGNPNLTGRANFGFVSKYQKGANVPSGETQFQFSVASFDFHSTAYEWLVVSGAKAQYKGNGTINGAGNYGFLLTATDGQVSGGGGVDKFRIKIWNINNGGVIVYDNVPSTSDDINNANPQAIGGGSIVIHK